MEVYDTINEMAERISANEPTIVSRRIKLYSSGVIAKIQHANYALTKLKELSTQSDVSSSNQDIEFAVSERLHFYVDSFFAFLYSSFDVIAQVINQKLHLDKNERKVSIKSIKDAIDNNCSGIPLNTILDQLFRSNCFKNLDKYRNCSTHRRQIYIRAETVTIEETPGYTATSELIIVKRLLCDDPFSLNPTVRQERELISYCENILNRVSEEIISISNNL